MQRKWLIERVYEEDFKRKLFEVLGLRNPMDEKKNVVVFKYSLLDDKIVKKYFDYHQSEFPRQLQ